MTKNTGAPSEQIFEDMLTAKYGTKVYIYRISDAKEAYGLNKRLIKITPRPADYVVTVDGAMFYAEIKSISHPTSGNFKLRKGQRTAALRQLAAGGTYFVFLHSLYHDQWYRIPNEYFLSATKWSWSDLKEFIFE